MSVKYKTYKLFDCQDFPKEIKAAFFEATNGITNDTIVQWTIGGMADEGGGGEEHTQSDVVDKWLKDQKIRGVRDGYTVLINHWW